jgi:hypothetical protein
VGGISEKREGVSVDGVVAAKHISPLTFPCEQVKR